MSRENVEIVRRVFEAEATREVSKVLKFYDPDVEMDWSESPFADFMEQGRHRGIPAVQKAFQGWYDAWEHAETEVHELIDAGDHVISVFTYSARGRTSGIQVQWEDMAGLWAFKDGLIARVAWLRSRAHAFSAAGLGEDGHL